MNPQQILIDAMLPPLGQPQPPFARENGEILAAGIPVIVTVGVMAQGMILTGRRRDNGLWTNPGGHMDAGEMPLEAARREVLEEAGIDLSSFPVEQITAERIISHRTGKEFAVLAFTCQLPDPVLVTTERDPDDEIEEWRWVPILMTSPELHPNRRHAKSDSIIKHLGLFEEDVKMEMTADQQKRLEETYKSEPVLTMDHRFLGYVDEEIQGKQQLGTRSSIERELSRLAKHVVHGK